MDGGKQLGKHQRIQRPSHYDGQWFDEYMFRVVAEKKYVPAKVLDILKQKPIRLPAWDPMFANEE